MKQSVLSSDAQFTMKPKHFIHSTSQKLNLRHRLLNLTDFKTTYVLKRTLFETFGHFQHNFLTCLDTAFTGASAKPPKTWNSKSKNVMLHTLGLFHSIATGTLWLKKSEESMAGKSGSSNRTPFCRHSCLSSSNDFPSDCVFSALFEPLPDKVDWRGIFFREEPQWMEKEKETWGGVWWSDSPAVCLMQGQACRVGRAGRYTPSREKLVCPPVAWTSPLPTPSLSLSCVLSRSLSLWVWPTGNCKDSFLMVWQQIN